MSRVYANYTQSVRKYAEFAQLKAPLVRIENADIHYAYARVRYANKFDIFSEARTAYSDTDSIRKLPYT